MHAEISIDSDITDKISWAKNCYMVNNELILGDGSIVENLIKLKKAVRLSRLEMERTGMLEECRKCAEDRRGPCCGSGIENRYSGTLLLINLMMGCKLPEIRSDPGGCFFLGINGCTLPARHVICVNYTCKEINDRIGPEKLQRLRENEGIELDLVFLLNEKIKKILNRK